MVEAFASLEPGTDLVLLAGDLTTCGDPAEAAVLADACRRVEVPVCAVLGNHDWHLNRTHEVVGRARPTPGSACSSGARCAFERARARGRRRRPEGLRRRLPGPRAPRLRRAAPARRCTRRRRRTSSALDRELAAIDGCDLRIVLLHYAPTTTTLEGEPRGIWAFLGSDRLAAPIAEHSPDLVLHGHAHAGTFEGYIGRVPVYNVAIQVTRKDFWSSTSARASARTKASRA